MAPVTASLFRHFRTYQVFGANTDVGKTIFSTLLLRASSRPEEKAWYLKPVSTGPDDEADVRHVQKYCTNVQTQNFYQFQDPVSPHLAVKGFAEVEDATLLSQISKQIRQNAEAGPGFMLVETAGGPHSPGPSGLSQVQLYRPLRMPVILIADSKLGGISTSISAFESLKIRGYDIDGVAMFQNERYQNHEYLQDYFEAQGVPLLSVPPTQALFESVPRDARDEETLHKFYTAATSHDNTVEFLPRLQNKHENRVQGLLEMSDEAYDRVWWPFAQHTELSAQGLNIIDSAYGDYFQTLRRPESPTDHRNLLQTTVDGSASWWTQGLGHGDSSLMLSAAHAAGRFGHVMFASGAHEPAIKLANSVIGILSNERLSKVFYSDNGSTAMEVGLKMALKAACDRYGWSTKTDRVDILGFTNSYHGDTIGAMDMSEPSVYNEKVPWYSGKGYWFDPPTVKMRQGAWVVEKPTADLGETTELSSIQDVFDSARDTSADAGAYENYIRSTLTRLTQHEQRKFGALVMEPVVLGAGGMMLVDPLFQRTLVRVVRESESLFATGSGTTHPIRNQNASTAWTGLPVLADEVFTGLYRLGHHSACSLLRIDPDISAHAKLLTGGLLPLSITAASQSIYDAFLSDHKTDALLHGHSYTAHPVGCAVANTSLDKLRDLAHGDAWAAYKGDWAFAPQSALSMFREAFSNLSLADANPIVPRRDGVDETPLEIWSLWSQRFVRDLSHSPRVDHVWALGSVVAIALKDPQGSGYTSKAAVGLRDTLLAAGGGGGGDGEWNIHSRVLGNILYLMTSQVTREEDVRLWEGRVRSGLGL